MNQPNTNVFLRHQHLQYSSSTLNKKTLKLQSHKPCHEKKQTQLQEEKEEVVCKTQQTWKLSEVSGLASPWCFCEYALPGKSLMGNHK